MVAPVECAVALVAQVPFTVGHSSALAGVQPGASGVRPAGPPPVHTTLGGPTVGTPALAPPRPIMPPAMGGIGFMPPPMGGIGFMPPPGPAPASGADPS